MAVQKDYPKDVLDIAREEAGNHKSSIATAVSAALARIKALPAWDTLAARLVYDAVQELIYEARHQVSTRFKRGDYGGPAKVAGTSATVDRAFRSVFDMPMGSSTIGRLTGLELDDVIASEGAIASGHLLNVRICRKLRNLTSNEQTVREAIKTEAKLKAILQAAQKESEAA